MRRIVQTDPTGCGVACVAMLAGITYAQARDEVFGPRHDGDHSTSTRDLRRALRRCGIRTARRLVPLRGRSPRRLLTRNAILKVNPGLDGIWHWVVWDAERRRLLDPRPQPYRRCRCVSFLTIG